MEQILADGGDIRLDDGELVVTPLKAEDVPESVKLLRAAVDRLLPRVELTDLLVEVDNWTGFSSELTGLENEPRSKDHQALLYGALLAGACNIPLAEDAQSAGLDVIRRFGGYPLINTEGETLNTLRSGWLIINMNFGCHLIGAVERYLLMDNAFLLVAKSGMHNPYRVITVTEKVIRLLRIPRISMHNMVVDLFINTVRDATYVLDEIRVMKQIWKLLSTRQTQVVIPISFLRYSIYHLVTIFAQVARLANQSLCRIKGMDLKYPSLKFTSNFRPEYVRTRWDDLLR